MGLQEVPGRHEKRAQGPLHPSKINDDVSAIKKNYQDEGYSNVDISTSTKPNLEKNTVEVVVEISEGVQIKIGGISVQGTQAFSEKKIYGQMKENKPGDKYKPDALNDDLKAIED